MKIIIALLACSLFLSACNDSDKQAVAHPSGTDTAEKKKIFSGNRFS